LLIHCRPLWLDNNDQWAQIMTDNKYVAATDFKANCLRLMDEVARQRRPIIITKRGKPVAKLVPVETEAIDLFGRMAGSIKICGDIINPIEDAGWTGDAENL
jgi:prevent-host-death family protein